MNDETVTSSCIFTVPDNIWTNIFFYRNSYIVNFEKWCCPFLNVEILLSKIVC